MYRLFNLGELQKKGPELAFPGQEHYITCQVAAGKAAVTQGAAAAE